MSEEIKEKKKFNLASFGKVIAFLFLEILAVISFSLGSSFIFYSILAVVIFVLVLIVTFKQIKVDGLASIGFFLFPLIIFGVLSILSYFKYDETFVMYNSPLLFLIPVGLTCFASVGYMINFTGSFKIHHALIVIYSAIAILTLLNFIVTMIQFVPFYTLQYGNYYYYYDGSPSSSPIGEMGYFLMGFSLQEVSLSYFCYYPMILLTAFLPLGHMRFKENKKLFVLYLAFGLLGLITIIFTINKITLLMLFGMALLIGIIALIDKFNINKKVIKVSGLVIGSIAVFGFIFLILNAQESVGIDARIPFLRNLTSNNAFLDRLFNSNRFVSAYNSILDGTFQQMQIEGKGVLVKLFGYPLHGGYVYNFGSMKWRLTDSNSFLFDSFFTSGFFGVLFLIFFLIIAIRRVILYYMHSDDDKKDKVMVLGFIIISLAYALINFDCTPYIFRQTVIPFYMNNIFLIDIFLFGYCFYKTEKRKEDVKEVKEEEINEVQE